MLLIRVRQVRASLLVGLPFKCCDIKGNRFVKANELDIDSAGMPLELVNQIHKRVLCNFNG